MEGFDFPMKKILQTPIARTSWLKITDMKMTDRQNCRPVVKLQVKKYYINRD